MLDQPGTLRSRRQSAPVWRAPAVVSFRPRPCENVHEPRKRRTAFSIAFPGQPSPAVLVFRLTKLRRTFYEQIERASFRTSPDPNPSFLRNSSLGPSWASSQAPGGVWLLPVPNTREVCDNFIRIVLTLRRIPGDRWLRGVAGAPAKSGATAERSIRFQPMFIAR